MPEPIYNANLILISSPAVSSFIPTETPGNVAVCVSGGGSRSMVAGMGQLLALETLRNENASLLSQTRLLSTVSGGSWVGVPFVFLPSGTSDEAFLGGPYMPPGSLTKSGISTLPEGCIASNITADFSIEFLAVLAVILHHGGIPDNMLWQVIMGIHFLRPYGLFQQTDGLPTTYFTYDSDAMHGIQSDNNGNPLATETPNMVAQVTGQTRPYYLCMTAMNVPHNAALVPVQCTPFFTGIVPRGPKDVNGRNVGGGGVTSFAFNSAPTSLSGNDVSIKQSRQWTLADILGASGAAFADLLIQHFKDFAAHPPRFAAALSLNRDSILRHVAHLGLDLDRAATVIDNGVSAVVRGDIATHQAILDFDPQAIVPSYQYWSPVDSTPNEHVNPSLFADGGSLDNTGLASVLTYSDIDNLIAFINSETPLTKDSNSVIVVDQMIPPLFGYQPYDEAQGYVPYSPNQPLVKSDNANYANNQIFASDQFEILLAGLWAASGNGKYLNSPIFKQTLTTRTNNWFGVVANRTVTVLWVYLENTVKWSNELTKEVSLIESGLVSGKMKFPHYSTADTELSPTEIQLLANLAAWTVINNSATFQSMYA